MNLLNQYDKTKHILVSLYYWNRGFIFRTLKLLYTPVHNIAGFIPTIYSSLSTQGPVMSVNEKALNESYTLCHDTDSLSVLRVVSRCILEE